MTSSIQDPSSPPPLAPGLTDPLRTALRDMWSSTASSWQEHAAHVDRQDAAVTAAMLDGTALGAGADVVELACGPGGAGLEAAERVGPVGTVLLSDVVPEMTAVAAARAHERGLTNVATRVLDLEAIDEPDASFDVALCRGGLMLVPDPARAAGEIHRVLRPGGRAAVAVWGPRERNPWLGILFDAVSAETGAPIPPPGVPGPFSLSDVGRLSAILDGAGFEDVSVSELDQSRHVASFDEWWSVVPALAGPIAAVLASLPPEVAARIRSDAEQRFQAYATPDGYDLPGVSVVACARR